VETEKRNNPIYTQRNCLLLDERDSLQVVENGSLRDAQVEEVSLALGMVDVRSCARVDTCEEEHHSGQMKEEEKHK
jgi:hypothetical protein